MLGFGARVSYAFRCFFALLLSGRVPDDILRTFAPPPAVAGTTGAPVSGPVSDAGGTERAVQVLGLFQRDGRLIDFLTEDIGGFSDAQIGAAVRDVHRNCRQVLDRYFSLEPVLADEEGQATTLGAPIDPSLVKVVGQVSARSSYRGVVRHRGWRAGQVNLPALPPTPAARAIVAPGEVEVG